jgi:ribosomal protein S18 acetylase RimI-like enzyme
LTSCRSSTVEVRRLGRQDAAALQELHWRIYAQGLNADEVTPVPLAKCQAMLDDPCYFVLGARSGDAWIGWAVAIAIRRWQRDKLFLYEVDVVEGLRRRGVGTSLIEAALAIARERSMAVTFVMTNASNEAAMALYRRTGAQRPHGDDVLLTWRSD